MSFINEILPTVGTVAGTAIGGPLGGVIGNGMAQIADNVLSSDSSQSTSATSAAKSPWGTNGGQDWPGGLKQVGSNSVDTGRYLIQFEEGEVMVFDKESNTSVRVWGDPHVETGDGDRGIFRKDNLTFDLPDGTKVTLKPSAVAANDTSVLDSMAITKGTQAVIVTGLDPSDGQAAKMSSVLNNADAVDAQYADGTVLRAGPPVDDLTFAQDGTELLGSEPNGAEHELDGKGGTALNGFQSAPATNGTGGTDRTSGTDGTSGAEGTSRSSDVGSDPELQQALNMLRSGASLQSILMMIVGRLEVLARQKINTINDKSSQLETAQKNGATVQNDDGSVVTENSLKTALMDVQDIQNLIKQITDAASNIQKSYHDANSNIASNIK